MNLLHAKRIEMLREAYDAGMSRRTAAAHCGVSKNSADRYYAIWSNADFGGEMKCFVKGDTKRRWKAEAEKRGVSMQGLLAFTVETVAEENLFEAVLG